MSANQSEWLVVGAGAAGIAAVGKLLDHGIARDKISWLDPKFSVGDLGDKWAKVPSNTKVDLFVRFFKDCQSFEFMNKPHKFTIEDLNPKDTCSLHHVVESLSWISAQLQKKVHAVREKALSMELKSNYWHVKTESEIFLSKNVILATGAEAKTLKHDKEVISLEESLDPDKLAKRLQPGDTVGVFGSSHSAILVLANLMQTNVKQVLNFYRSPLRYAVDMGDWILYDNTGLKGFTAKWAKQNIDGTLPKNIERISVANQTTHPAFSRCNKMIYAVGFETRKLPLIQNYESCSYDDKTGIIAPNLFGFGIAYPQGKLSPLGHQETQVGMWKFMTYLNQVLPIWLRYT